MSAPGSSSQVLTFDYTLELSHLEAMALYEIENNPKLVQDIRKRGIISVLMFWAMSATFYIFWATSTPAMIYGFLSFLGGILVYFLLIRTTKKRTLSFSLKCYDSSAGGKSLLGKQHLVCEPEHLTVISNQRQSKWHYSSFGSMNETDTVAMIRVSVNEVLVIPRASNSENISKLFQIIEQKKKELGAAPAAIEADERTSAKYTLTMEDIEAFTRFHQKKLTRLSKQRAIYFFAIMGLLLLLEYYSIANKESALSFMAITSVVMTLFYVVSYLQARREYRSRLLDLVGRDYILVINEEGLEAKSNRGEALYVYSDLQELVNQPDYWFIYPSPLAALIIPKRGIQDKAAAAFLEKAASQLQIDRAKKA